MFFTQDDYKKIQQWLTKNSVKDTEFNEANIPFNGEETITIVQGNQNKKVFLKDLINQVFNLGISDFVNITDKYDAPNISLEEAIRLIPSRARKEGQVITFLDMEDHWHIYQFKGALNQWNILDTWEDLFDWEKLIVDSILPDEEDLTKSEPDANGNSYLSLKDRAYNPEDFSGLGRVILRKHVMEVEDPIYGKVKKNILYQDMLTQSNTVYEIRYDFDLNNQTITIPENCTLKYEGGSLNNGHIVYQNTKIQGIESINDITTEGLFVVIDAVIDEEDLHTNNGVLKFADREYNPNAFSGLGKIILRKNIVNGKNILTQELINKPNTIYIIQYDYDLNGAEITIPEGCVLDFQGGSLSNGTLAGNNTSINSTLVKIFSLDIYFKGNWYVSEAYPEWFGAKCDKVTNNTAFIQKTLDSFNTTKLVGYEGYGIYPNEDGVCIKLPKGKQLIGNKREYTPSTQYNTLLVYGINVVGILGTGLNTITNISLRGVNVTGFDQERVYTSTGIKLQGRNNHINNVDVSIFHIGFETISFETTLVNCLTNVTKVGFYCHGETNNKWYENGGITTSEMTSLTLMNCYAMGSTMEGYVLQGMNYSSIISCAADGCGIPFENVAVTNQDKIFYPYYFTRCTSCSVIACGAEVCGVYMRIHRSSAISVDNCHCALDFRIASDSNVKPHSIVRLDYASGISIKTLTVVKGSKLELYDASSVIIIESASLVIMFAPLMAGTLGANLLVNRGNISNWGDSSQFSVSIIPTTLQKGTSLPSPYVFSIGDVFMLNTDGKNKPVFNTGSSWVDATGTDV